MGLEEIEESLNIRLKLMESHIASLQQLRKKNKDVEYNEVIYYPREKPSDKTAASLFL